MSSEQKKIEIGELIDTPIEQERLEQKRTEIGELIDTLIEQERAKQPKGLTAYLEDIVSPEAGLSPRQIGRIRTLSADFPEGEAIQKLAKAIPQTSILDPSDITNRLLWGWRNIAYDQDNFKIEKIKGKQVGHTVTIFSGWQQPIGLTNEDVVRSISRNIEKDFIYIFVYPDSSTCPGNKNNDDVLSMISGWIEELKNKVSYAWVYENRSSVDRNQLSEKLNYFIRELDSKIKYTQAAAETDVWLRLPSNYCIMYNIGISQRDSQFRYGSFKVEGRLTVSLNQIDEILSGGWLHTSKRQYEIIESSYKDAVCDWMKLIPESLQSEV
jgi:hypothetical protein